MTITAKPFFASCLSNLFKRVSFKRMTQLSQFDFAIKSTSAYSLKTQKNFEDIIRQKYPHIQEAYVVSKFGFYPYVVVITKQGKLQGLMMINYFMYDQEIYLYVGPVFFLSKLALCLGAMTLLEHFLSQTTCLNLLGELQNVELLIHLHTVMPQSRTFPQMDNFAWNDQAKAKLNRFIANIPQLDPADPSHFKSNTEHSLFKERPGQREVLDWLKLHQIDLAQGDNLFILSVIYPNDLATIRHKIWWSMLNYPAHRIAYINGLQQYNESL